MARVYLHIGPPKTGSTSLQYAFEELPDTFIFVGAYQPRERNQGSLSQRLHKCACDSSDSPGSDREAISGQLQELVAAGKDVVISEEMFLLDQPAISFRDKLAQARDILKDIPVTVLVTLRDPAEALPSLYQEIYQGLPATLKLSFAAFCADSRASCYDYMHVIETLYAVGFEEIRPIAFEEIASGRFSLSNVFGRRADALEALELGAFNTGKTSGGSDRRTLPALTLKNLGQFRWLKALVDKTGMRKSYVYRWLINSLDRVSIRKGAGRQLVIPERARTRFADSWASARVELGLSATRMDTE